MDFDLSKENIQPLRGGRNAQQLEMALQAQTQQEYQHQLLAQKEEFEAHIRNYQGADPLEPYYNYIAWIEQSYPKSGHEGNCQRLLEHCLGQFENDSRYTNDRRFCKLWIKYIDHFANPIELYLMMKAKNLCTGCADFYKAWAYYHEIAGDFQEANNVLEEGKRNLAQPYEELEIAQKNLFTAAGETMINGPNQSRLLERREALTSLHFRNGRVGSVRIPSSHPQTTVGHHGVVGHTNAAVNVYEDQAETSRNSVVPPESIVGAVRCQEVPKENKLAAGTWHAGNYASGYKPKPKTASFKILEETPLKSLYPNMPSKDSEEFSWFDRIPLTILEEMLPHQKRLYPKAKVYCDPGTEYCLEEIELSMRLQRPRHEEEAITTINLDSDEEVIQDEDDDDIQEIHILQSNPVPKPQFEIFSDHQNFLQDVFNRSNEPSLTNNNLPATSKVSSPQKVVANVSIVQPVPVKFEILEDEPTTHVNMSSSKLRAIKAESSVTPKVNHKNGSHLGLPPNNPFQESSKESPINFGFAWTPPQASPVTQQDEFPMAVVQPKSIKTNAFRELAVDELVETGSRHGGAMAAQPTDGARNIEDDEMMGDGVYLNETCSTQQFNFNLNAMQVSTPQNKNKPQDAHLTDSQNSRRNLFRETAQISKAEPKILSTIMEETKSGYGSSSCSSASSGGATTKSTIFNSHHKMNTISEEHTGYLAQNLMANAELRRSLLGNLIDDESPTSPAVRSSMPTPMVVSQHETPAPELREEFLDLPPPRDETLPLPLANGQPLSTVPTDPFASSLIEKLLERLNFPGVHRDGYIPIEGCPTFRVNTKQQSPLFISSDQYIIEKMLGKGQYGTVYKAFDRRRQTNVALKVQRPPNKWEFYICRELAARLQNHDLRDRFMDIDIGYFSKECSILVSKFEPFGSLLDVVNVLKANGTRTKEPLCFYLTLEMLSIVKAMHEVKIIHADIKPDNFLVVLQNDNSVRLQLIDFGCSIDMTLFPEGATFRQAITTENFVCCEVLDRRPWSYHTDLFCIAASAYVLLFNDYIQMKKVSGSWSISSRLPRYCKIDLWNMFFSSLLNQQSGPADIATLELLFREEVEGPCKKDLPSQIRHVVNLLKKR